MPWIPNEEHEKVPVVKNLLWAIKILFKADKWFLLNGFVQAFRSIRIVPKGAVECYHGNG